MAERDGVEALARAIFTDAWGFDEADRNAPVNRLTVDTATMTAQVALSWLGFTDAQAARVKKGAVAVALRRLASAERQFSRGNFAMMRECCFGAATALGEEGGGE